MMDIEAFGEALIETGDLDPVYVALHGARLPDGQLARLLLAYFCFYHLGLAAWLSEQADFWGACEIAARNEVPSPLGGRWPRASERRHFRGQKCVDAIRWLAKREPEERLETFHNARTVRQVFDLVADWPMFGPWISFKIADVLERCVGIPIQFTEDVCLLYDGPRAALLARAPDGPAQELHRLLGVFSKMKAPPARDRPCGYQEVETVLCKWAAQRTGYFVGKDVREIRHALTGWGATANRLRTCAPAMRGAGLFGDL